MPICIDWLWMTAPVTRKALGRYSPASQMEMMGERHGAPRNSGEGFPLGMHFPRIPELTSCVSFTALSKVGSSISTSPHFNLHVMFPELGLLSHLA